jgi:threonine dehydrogenase-like Zn-dependent dehydrogenase
MSDTMLAAVFEGDGKLELRDVPVPKIQRPDEVLLEVEAAAICGTDIQILRVPPGHPATPGAILGHEYVRSLADIAISLACRGGRVMLFGQNSQARTAIAQNDITRNEITIMASYIAKHTFPKALRIIESGRLNLKPLITHRLKLNDIHKGMEAMQNGEAMKVIINNF